MSVIRFVECFQPLRPEQITDPALIAAVQVSQELGQVYVPMNKKTPKEAQSWSAELARQAVPDHVLRCMARDINDQHEEGARLKRAVAALAYVSGLLGTAARVAELLHPKLQLGERVERLNLRLTLGITGAAVELARHAGGELTRGDYRRLTAARLCRCDEILKVEDAALLSCLDCDKKRLAIVRAAAERFAAVRVTAESAAPPMLAPYAA